MLISIAVLLLLVILWTLVLQWIDRQRARAPRGTWDAFGLWLFAVVYARLLHRAKFENVEPVLDWAREQQQRPPKDREPLILAPNHTAGVDPVLIQIVFPVEIRWMMMRRMNVGIVQRFTEYLRIILVDQDGGDTSALREAIRHLRGNGVLGVFPEGGLERPPGRLRPFQPGLGMLALKTRAAVLPVWISGTPYADSALQSLLKPSRSRVVFGEFLRFDRMEATPEDIRNRVQRAIVEMSGWDIGEPETESTGALAAAASSDPSATTSTPASEQAMVSRSTVAS
ncbi:MAG: lysophospholipid acyltransferase family protein [Planctomycetota bacterium]